MNSNNEAIVYQSISSIPLEQTSSRNSEGSEAPIVESGLEPSGGNQNVSMDDNRNDVSLEIPSTEAANESSKTMHRWIKFRNRKRADEFARSDTQKVPVPWKQLLCRREVWAIIVSQFCGSLGFFVMQSWVPTFYLDFFGVDVGKIGYFTVLPSAVQGAMGLCAGYLGDKAIRDWNWSPLAVRRLAHTATMAMVFLTIGMALNGFTMVGASAYQHDFCPEHAGFIFSLGNTAGSMPAIFGVYFVGALLDATMVNRNTLDFALHMLNATIFHLSFPFFLIPLIKLYGFSNESFAFLMAAVYGVILFALKIALYLHERSQRREGKVDWEDEIVLITGGASGVGYLLAEMLAIRHITVVVLDVHPVKSALDIESYICDVSDPLDIARVAKEIREDVGEPTILVNNAGIVHGRSILDLSIKDIQRTMNVNFLGQALTIKEFLPDMIKNNHGHIISVSSAMGIMAAPQIADYAASKAAVKAFHETLESEIKYVYKTPGVRTTLVCCGKIETGMFHGVKERMPFFTPTLEPLDVVKEIMESMEQRRTCNQIMMPFYVNFVPLVSIMPSWFQNLARTISGADQAMGSFVGKEGVKPKETLYVVEAFTIGDNEVHSLEEKKDL
ncbi:hypothetical protein FBU30_004503 [Linnemannia zychae]|nr:hypothetical protein FBU30_004503 [Linnemannia zychae]